MVLTPTKPVPREWFGRAKGARVLGLACGEGSRCPFSPRWAQSAPCLTTPRRSGKREMVARREGYDTEIVHADMTKLGHAQTRALTFFHPVSNVYIEQVEPVWRECFRVLKRAALCLRGG